MEAEHPVACWHRLVAGRNPAGLEDLVAEDAVFFSPVVHSPQRGRKVVVMYLSAAFGLLAGPSFRYVREIVGPTEAMLEFETVIDGIAIILVLRSNVKVTELFAKELQEFEAKKPTFDDDEIPF